MSIFNSIRVKRGKRTSFSLSNKYVGNVGFGSLIPIMCHDMVPGDKFKFSSEVLVETFPMLAPIYGDMDVKVEYFFVPNRLLWSGWEQFITGGEDGLDSSHVPCFVSPNKDKISIQDYKFGLWDYLGLPLVNDGVDKTKFYLDTDGSPVTLLPFNAYRRIWNEWYRNENIQDELKLFDGDIGVDSSDAQDINKLMSRNWRKDYFTSSLPWVQRGVAPLVNVDGKGVEIDGITYGIDFKHGSDDIISLGGPSSTQAGDYTIDYFYFNDGSTARSGIVYFDGTEFQYVDVSSSSGRAYASPKSVLTLTPSGESKVNGKPKGYYSLNESTGDATIRLTPLVAIPEINSNVDIQGLAFDINELRRVNAVQRWLERNARAGARYIEQIASHFGVVVPDYRLQRSEFIGGITKPVRVGQVLQTNTPDAEPTMTDALGTPSGQASSGIYTGRRSYTALEHGWLMAIMSIVPRAEYFQGTSRKFSRKNRFDYYFPEFAHLGEEVVKKSELLTYPYISEGLDDTFGYQSRYASYKWERNYIVADFRDSMKYWTLSRELSAANPNNIGLNDSFIKIDNPSNRTLYNVFSVPSNERPFRFYVKNHVIAKRPMPKYGTPRL